MNSSARRRRTTMSPSSSSALSHDTVVDILSRLPVKSLTRFRSVSKHWSDLTANPTFISAHLRRSVLNPSLLLRRYHIPSGGGFGILLLDDQDSQRFPALNLEVPLLGTLNRFPRMVGSSNGLLCLDISPCHGLDFVLWNISIRQFQRLPLPAINSLENKPIHMVSLGFGFDRVNNDFKLVRIVYVADSSRSMDEPPSIKAEVFSWRRGSWNEIDADYGLTICGAHNGVEVNGTLYWVTIGLGEGLNRKSLLSFDMADEGFGSLPLPATNASLNLMSYKGSLAFAVYPGHGPAASELQLWLMNGMDGERANWAHMFTISGLPRNVAPVGMFCRDVELALKQMKGDTYCLWFYEHSTTSHKLVLDMDNFWFDVCPYVESLVPVSGRN